MLEKSNEKFPYNMALLERPVSNSKQVNVIGHSRLCRVYGEPEAAFVESGEYTKKTRVFKSRHQTFCSDLHTKFCAVGDLYGFNWKTTIVMLCY